MRRAVIRQADVDYVGAWLRMWGHCHPDWFAAYLRDWLQLPVPRSITVEGLRRSQRAVIAWQKWFHATCDGRRCFYHFGRGCARSTAAMLAVLVILLSASASS